ncbi:hypothetical protein C8J56DRAFT_959808 [Mycena floridula]|nr:hypothetical protein C8J56DRAFT_959808 [Mycena floridula]
MLSYLFFKRILWIYLSGRLLVWREFAALAFPPSALLVCLCDTSPSRRSTVLVGGSSLHPSPLLAAGNHCL